MYYLIYIYIFKYFWSSKTRKQTTIPITIIYKETQFYNQKYVWNYKKIQHAWGAENFHTYLICMWNKTFAI